MEENKSKVYIKIDSENRIIRCEGGYTMGNITNIEEWIFIDEGTGDKYNLCQSHYFDGGLHTVDGICRYLYLGDKKYRLRTDEEMEADKQEPQPIQNTMQEEIDEIKEEITKQREETTAIQKELEAEKQKNAAMAEELAAAKILLGVE